MEAIVELPLESPRKLFIFDFAGLQQELVGMNLGSSNLEFNLDLDTGGRGVRAKIEKRVLITGQLSCHSFKEFVHGYNGALNTKG